MEINPGYEGAVYAADVALERARNDDLDSVVDSTTAARDYVEGAPFPDLVARIEEVAAAAIEVVAREDAVGAELLERLHTLRSLTEEVDAKALEKARMEPWGTKRDGGE
jgi:hypothetical protein